MSTTRVKQKTKSGEVAPTISPSCHGGAGGALPPDLDKLRTMLLSDLTSTLTTTVKSVVEEALEPLSAALDDVRSATDSLGQKMTNMEEALSDHSDRIVALESACARLQSENVQLKDKVEDLESRSRRNNLRVVGIPEKLEGADPVKFMSDFFMEVLGANFFSSPPLLDRAHRIGPPRPSEEPGTPRPRVFIVRFHYYTDKERILRRKRDTQQLKYSGQNVYIFPDMTASLAKKRAAFAGVKRSLHQKQVKFALLFPARLRVEHNVSGEKKIFDCPTEAQKFCDSHFCNR